MLGCASHLKGAVEPASEGGEKMCVHPQPVDPVPEETARVTRAAFPKPTVAMNMSLGLSSLSGWHARQGTGFDISDFEIDWVMKVAIYPEGQESSNWYHRTRHGKRVINIGFSRTVCGACPSKDLCISSTHRSLTDKSSPFRKITVASMEHYEALKLAREREHTLEYAREYAYRGGVEGTFSRGVRAHGLRRTRYRGLKRVHLGHALTAAAVNFARIGEWWCGLPLRSSPPLHKLTTQPTIKADPPAQFHISKAHTT